MIDPTFAAIIQQNRGRDRDQQPVLPRLEPRFSDYDVIGEGNGQQRCYNAPGRQLLPDTTHRGDPRTAEQILYSWAPPRNGTTRRLVEPTRRRQEWENQQDTSALFGYRQQSVRGYNDVVRATQYNCETYNCPRMGDTGQWSRQPADAADIYGLTHGFRNIPEAHTDQKRIVLSRTVIPPRKR